MSKITESQRKYFVSRVSSKMNDVIASLKQQNASAVTKMAQEKFDDYLKSVNVLEDLETLEQLEAAKDKVADRLEATAMQIQEVLVEAGHIGQYDKITFWKSDKAESFRTHFQKFCNITCSKESKSGIAKDIAELESKRDEAVDFLYGLSNENELTHGVAEILKGTGVKLIG
jgi:hypothetical protein